MKQTHTEGNTQGKLLCSISKLLTFFSLLGSMQGKLKNDRPFSLQSPNKFHASKLLTSLISRTAALDGGSKLEKINRLTEI